MNNGMWLVVEREYRARVAKKSFILTTILTPLVLVGAIILVVVLMLAGDSRSSVLVVDNSGEIYMHMKSSDDLAVIPVLDATVDSALRRTDVDGVLVIPRDIVSQNNPMVKYYSNGPTSMTIEGNLRSQVKEAIEQRRLEDYNIPDLKEVLDRVNANVIVSTYRNDEDPDEETTSSIANYAVGYGLTFVLYMFILIYGQLIMTSIIEEKNNRVMEVVVSSVSPARLMMGKILGTALVAVTQVVIWVVLFAVLFGMALPALIPAELMEQASAYQNGTMATGAAVDTEQVALIGNILQLTSLGFLAKMAGLTLAYLVGGFLLYASIFAAVGASVDNAQDASQLSMLGTLPTIVGMLVGMAACVDPNTSVAFWCSLIPFTSPMVMMARIPAGIPGWEIAVSLALLYVTFVFVVWLAAKIYRVGIFMYGKKPTLKDLARWVTYK